MFDANDHVIHLVDGRLSPRSRTSRAALNRIVERSLASSQPSGIVVHFHGGLVSESAARRSAEQCLYPLYAERAQAYPIFFVWESGLFEAPLNNLHEIVREKLFREFVKKTAVWALKKIPGLLGWKGTGSAVDEQGLAAEFDAWFDGQRTTPPEATRLLSSASSKSAHTSRGSAPDEDELVAELEESIAGDTDFQDTVEAVHRGLLPAPADGLKSLGGGDVVAANSLISPSAADRLFETPGGATKGFGPISWFKVAKVVATIVLRVIRRHAAGRTHGGYTTVVEEVLRELYIDKLGKTAWWDRMKQDTADAFGSDAACGGAAFLLELHARVKDLPKPPRITLVGHSTGAIYICNLLSAAAHYAPTLKFDVIFEAPAVTYDLLARTLSEHASRIGDFRQFAMSDERESADGLVPILYRRSLLYFVSGMLETEVDAPLVGMARFLDDASLFDDETFPSIAACRKFFAARANRLIWAPSSGGAGLSSDGHHHSEFDDVCEVTMASVQHILQHGF